MSAVLAKRPKSRKPRFPLRVIKGGYAPADASAASELRNRGHRVGDLLFAEFTKPRNPQFNRLVHAFGKLLAQNLDAFTGRESHAVLKRLQIEGDIACDTIALNFPGVGPCEYRVPKSLAFESMDEGEFETVFGQFCDYVSRKYWTGVSPEKIANMAQIMERETP